MASEGWEQVSNSRHLTEASERKRIREWMTSDGHWSGFGRHVSEASSRQIAAKIHASHDDVLGQGAYGFVQKITYRGVTLVQKRIRCTRNRRIESLRDEADIMEKLDHQHIVTLIGTYTSPREFVLVSYPVAQCNLQHFLTDIDNIRAGDGYDLVDTAKHLENLGFGEMEKANAGSYIPSLTRPLEWLRSLLGCITDAIAFVHAKRIRHRDIKPENILLSPGQVFLTDFGISRDLKDCPSSYTQGSLVGTRSYQAPEVADEEDHHMSPADIFSLGAVFLTIAFTLYGLNPIRFSKMMRMGDQTKRAAALADCLKELRSIAQKGNAAEGDFTCLPRHFVGLIEDMMAFHPAKRPSAQEVSRRLTELGGINQVYHGTCCRRSSEELSKIIDSQLKTIVDMKLQSTDRIKELERRHEADQAEIQSLRAINETYRLRMEHEQTRVDERYKILLAKRDQELAAANEARKALEAELASLKSARRHHRRDRSHIPPRLMVPEDHYNCPSDGRKPSIPRSNLPVPVRPSTPIRTVTTPPKRPSLGKESLSTTSTLIDSIHSASSRDTLLKSPMSSASNASKSADSSPPDSPRMEKMQRFSGSMALSSKSLLLASTDMIADKSRRPPPPVENKSAQSRLSWADMARALPLGQGLQDKKQGHRSLEISKGQLKFTT